MEFTDTGREAFARVTKRIAERGRDASAPESRLPERPGRADRAGLPALRDHARQQDRLARDDRLRQNPEGIDGRTGAPIEGIGTIEETQDLAESLRIGALPIELKLISQTQVSATLGQQALDQGLTAAAVGLALTILFLLVFYRVLGLVATVALLIYAIFLFALVKLIPITLTLPGIAGLVLTLAVAADANIVMYERIKEEVRAGRSIPSAISAGYSKALRTIIDANVVTIGVAFILFTLATAGVKGFAFTLGVGTLVSLFTAVLATSAILGTLARTRLLRRPSALGVGPKESKGWKFDFMGKSRWFFSFSGVILAVGRDRDRHARAQLRHRLRVRHAHDDAARAAGERRRGARRRSSRSATATRRSRRSTTRSSATTSSRSRWRSSTRTQVTEVEQRARRGLRRGRRRLLGAPRSGPTFGEQIARTAVLAVIASLLLISLYIGFRFEFKFAVPVLIALAHDLLITAGVYALFDREVTTATVAALLTIMGYSLYDTVIVFDRIRENVPRMPRATFSQIANRSMSEVFTRSLATSFVVLMPVGALLLFGGETLKDFAFALLVGVVSGAYSSIFIATPVLVEWKEREQTYMRRRRLILEEHGGPRAGVRAGRDRRAAVAAAAAASGPAHRASRRRRRAAAAGTAGASERPRPGRLRPHRRPDGAPPPAHRRRRPRPTPAAPDAAARAAPAEPAPPRPARVARGPDGAGLAAGPGARHGSQAEAEPQGEAPLARKKKHGRRWRWAWSSGS